MNNHKLFKNLLLCSSMVLASFNVQAMQDKIHAFMEKLFAEPEPQFAEWQYKLLMTDEQAAWLEKHAKEIKDWEQGLEKLEGRLINVKVETAGRVVDVKVEIAGGVVDGSKKSGLLPSSLDRNNEEKPLFVVKKDWKDVVYAEKAKSFIEQNKIPGIKVVEKRITIGQNPHTIESFIAKKDDSKLFTVEEVKNIRKLFEGIGYENYPAFINKFVRDASGDLVFVDTEKHHFLTPWQKWWLSDYEKKARTYQCNFKDIHVRYARDHFLEKAAIDYIDNEYKEEIRNHPHRLKPLLNFMNKPIVKLAAGVTAAIAATVALSVAVYKLCKGTNKKKDN